jgi:DNA-binding CsgD family transcriptional regulator
MPPSDPAADLIILQMLAEGASIKKIATHFGVSRRSITARLGRIRRQYCADNNAHLVAIILRAGVITPPQASGS